MSITVNQDVGTQKHTLPEQIDKIDQIISFTGNYGKYCVCMVDAVNSTKITAGLSTKKACEYYSIFINTMASIAIKHDARIIKNVGDSLLYCYPKSLDYTDIALANPLECGMAMIDSQDNLNKKMNSYGLPPVKFRISSDYGTVMLAKSYTNSCDDMFGSTVNICTKINRLAKDNQMVIGDGLYQIVKNSPEFEFKIVKDYSIGLQYDYPVFTIRRKL